MVVNREGDPAIEEYHCQGVKVVHVIREEGHWVEITAPGGGVWVQRLRRER
jgi:hypothetical protein